MDLKTEWKALLLIVVGFVACFWLPVGSERFLGAVGEALHLARWYAREHVLLCLIPAFFIAGAIAVFLNQASVIRYLGARANRVLSYAVASVSGAVLAVCSCTVLPLFAGIYRRGAGLGPATAFLYAGPAINVLAIILTARLLGPGLGVARAVGAVVFSIVIGVAMHLLFRKEERRRSEEELAMPERAAPRPLWQTALFFAAMVGVLVAANWGGPREFQFTTAGGGQWNAVVLREAGDDAGREELHLKLTGGPRAGTTIELAASEVLGRVPVGGWATAVWRHKWLVTGVFAAALAVMLVAWLGLSWWRVAAVGVVAVVAAVLFPAVPMVAFAAAVLGLSLLTMTSDGEPREWFDSTWGFARQILPLLLLGVLAAGLLLGRPDHAGLIPPEWVHRAVGGNSVSANFFAAIAGALMYFATLTEVPIVQGLVDNGMGPGPALALLLAGPAVSLPNMLVIRSVLGTKKTLVYLVLVVVMATVSGCVYGVIAA